MTITEQESHKHIFFCDIYTSSEEVFPGYVYFNIICVNDILHVNSQGRV